MEKAIRIKSRLEDQIKELARNSREIKILEEKYGSIASMPYYDVFDIEHERKLDLEHVATDLQLKYSDRKEILIQISVLAEMESKEYQSILNQN